ncbi:uncharacterized protein LOC117603282 [Osmia lignaria lignaria]|uniref:uncharacterized protein LOC117603282 n=1 Tax=Osmia lignaria lignaria TaxID=1437193 RepID=UPI00402BD550
MSMLAERRQKQKWTLNPRGKQWSEDGEKFGQKMLEKMGWTSGKGLGANEQGMTEHVRVSVKNDKSGIGFKQDALEEAWTEHQESFNDFLQKLQTEQSETIVQIEEVNTELSGKSLELKSKHSRARVHYQKFTRGKDVNKYSSKDLANIFGQKEINMNKGSKETNTEEESSVAINTPENNNGVIVINGGSMTDYFMKKGKDISLMSKRKKKPESNSESEPEYAGFGFASPFGKAQSRNEENKEMKNSSNYAFENPCMELNSPENISNSTEIGSLKKRKSTDETESSLNQSIKKFKDDNVSSVQYENGIVNVALNLDSQSEDVYNGQEFEVSRVQFGLANSALDLSDEVEKKRVTFNDHVEYSTDSIKNKKGRSKLDKFEVENKKAKKKKKKKKQEDVKNSVSYSFTNEALDTEDKPEEINDNEINERKSKKSKKRKESRRSNLETIVEAPEEDKEIYEDGIEKKNINTDENISEIQENESHKKSKKKKRKEEVKEISIDDRMNAEEIIETNFQSENGECELQKDQGNISKEKKKMKKKKKERVDPDMQHEDVSETNMKASDEVDDNNEKTEEEVVKVKKNKKKKKDASVTDSNIEVENVEKGKENMDNVHENTFETEKEKEKNSIDESTVDNNNFTQRNHVYQKNPVEKNTSARDRNNKNNRMFKTVSSPWREKTTMSKKILRSLFYKTSEAQFPGANMSEIKGYGVNIQ